MRERSREILEKERGGGGGGRRGYRHTEKGERVRWRCSSVEGDTSGICCLTEKQRRALVKEEGEREGKER